MLTLLILRKHNYLFGNSGSKLMLVHRHMNNPEQTSHLANRALTSLLVIAAVRPLKIPTIPAFCRFIVANAVEVSTIHAVTDDLPATKLNSSSTGVPAKHSARPITPPSPNSRVPNPLFAIRPFSAVTRARPLAMWFLISTVLRSGIDL